MAEKLAAFSLLTTIFATCIAVACAYGAWRWASESSRRAKKFAALEDDLTELRLSHSKMHDWMRKISNREAARTKHEGNSNGVQPSRDSKAALRAKYLNGRDHIAVAKLHKQVDLDDYE